MTESNDPGRNARLEDLVSRALDLPVDQRDAFLRTECGDDAELLGEARSWLEGSVSADTGFLAPPQMARGTQDPAGQAAAQDGGHALVLGDYEVLEQIGEGGMARVYRARSQRTGQEAAIKVISAHAGLSNRHLERFHRESLNQGRLNHPGIVPVYADGQQDQWHWIAQELVDGHDLERELRTQRREPLPNDPPNLLPRPGHPERTSKVIEIIAQAAEALDHAHQHGVVHRDVKPSNLLLRPSGRVLLADFGLSRDEAMGSLTRTDEIAGSLYYMSPEQTRSLKDRVDHRTDVYSLGVVLYELLALRRPFEAGTSVELIKRISESTYRPLRSRVPDVPEPLEIIVDRALSRNPEQRFATMADFAEDLRRFQRGKPILSRKPTWGRRLNEWAYRNRQWLPAAVLVALLSPLGAQTLMRLESRENFARVEIAPDFLKSAGLEPGSELRVEALRLDALTDTVLSRHYLGRRPGDHSRLEQGHYVFEIYIEGQLHGEWRRRLLERSELSLQLPQSQIGPDVRGMVPFEGGSLALNDGEGYERFLFDRLKVDVQPYLLDSREVSNREYAEYLEATGARPPKHWNELTEAHLELPVVGVGLLEARSYAEWRGKRLPTLAEWIWAARGAEQRLVPWSGEELWEPRGNINGSPPSAYPIPIADYFANARAVDSTPECATPSGVLHLFGNVWEYTETVVFDRASDIESEWVAHEYMRFVAGGPWWAGSSPGPWSDLRNTFIGTTLELEDRGDSSTGFRCARSMR